MQRFYTILSFFCIVFLIGCVWASNKKDDVISGNKRTDSPEEVAAKKKFNVIVDTVSTDYLMGKFDPAKHIGFVKIDQIYTDKPAIYLHREAYEAFVKMAEHAKKDKIQLRILSATRNFEKQKKIWEDKWTGIKTIEDGTKASKIEDPTKRALKILLYSAMPGTSRHHWGTDIDLNYLSDEYFTHGQGEKIYQWLQKNAHQYGYCQPYSDKSNGRTGYNEEKWHWSYIPLSAPFTAAAESKLKNEMLNGFEGHETGVSINIVEKYVLGINQDCLKIN